MSIDNFDISATVNGGNFAMIRDVEVTFIDGELKAQGKDWVNNYMAFTVFGIDAEGTYPITTAEFIFIDDPTVSYIAEQQSGILTISEYSEQRLVGTFGMNLNNPDGEFAEVKEGIVDLNF